MFFSCLRKKVSEHQSHVASVQVVQCGMLSLKLWVVVLGLALTHSAPPGELITAHIIAHSHCGDTDPELSRVTVTGRCVQTLAGSRQQRRTMRSRCTPFSTTCSSSSHESPVANSTGQKQHSLKCGGTDCNRARGRGFAASSRMVSSSSSVAAGYMTALPAQQSESGCGVPAGTARRGFTNTDCADH